MGRWVSVAVLALLVLAGAVGLRNAAVSHVGNAATLVANGVSPPPPTPW